MTARRDTEPIYSLCSQLKRLTSQMKGRLSFSKRPTHTRTAGHFCPGKLLFLHNMDTKTKVQRISSLSMLIIYVCPPQR